MAEMLFSSMPYGIAEGISPYLLQRRKFYDDNGWNQLIQALKITKTLYVGNLSFYTSEEQIYELFSRCGPVKRVIMGLNKVHKTPCGFCFVEYYSHDDAVACKKFLSGTKLDERVIRADLDPGFEEGRQYGRSRKSGGQIRDDHRTDYDSGRGGWGTASNPESKGSQLLPMNNMQAVGTTFVRTDGPRGPDKEDSGERPAKRQRVHGPSDGGSSSSSSGSGSGGAGGSSGSGSGGAGSAGGSDSSSHPRLRERNDDDEDM